MPKKTLAETQHAAQKFVVGYIGNNSFSLSDDLDEDRFATSMNAIVQAMMAAWLDGYIAGAK